MLAAEQGHKTRDVWSREAVTGGGDVAASQPPDANVDAERAELHRGSGITPKIQQIVVGCAPIARDGNDRRVKRRSAWYPHVVGRGHQDGAAVIRLVDEFVERVEMVLDGRAQAKVDHVHAVLDRPPEPLSESPRPSPESGAEHSHAVKLGLGRNLVDYPGAGCAVSEYILVWGGVDRDLAFFADLRFRPATHGGGDHRVGIVDAAVDYGDLDSAPGGPAEDVFRSRRFQEWRGLDGRGSPRIIVTPAPRWVYVGHRGEEFSSYSAGFPAPVAPAFGPPVRPPGCNAHFDRTTLLPSTPDARGNCEFSLLGPSSWTSLSGDLGVLPCRIRVIKIPTCPSPEISHASFADGHWCLPFSVHVRQDRVRDQNFGPQRRVGAVVGLQ